MDEDRESTSSIEESEEEIYSEQNEINYWESLTTGMLPFPAPLRLQSLLFIIGRLDEYGNETLALLPPRTRRVLLLNLPVIDVCRLEGSGVTEGIDMEEVWKTLYYNRLPTNQVDLEESLTTVDDMQELTWKDCYFSSLFSLKCMYVPDEDDWGNGYVMYGDPDDDDCHCNFGNHLQQDLLYGIYIRNGTLEVQQCFGPRNGSCFGVATYARRCCRLAPMRYIHQFPNQLNTARGHHDHTPPTTICATIPTLVEVCKFETKTFSASDISLIDYFDAECFTDDYFPYLKLFLGGVRCLQIIHDQKQLHPGWKNILDAIFCSTHCKLNELNIHQRMGPYMYGSFGDQLMAFLVPYFSPSPGVDTSTLNGPYVHLQQLHIDGTIQSTTDVLNTALILKHQNNLEVVSVSRFSSEAPDTHTECIALALVNLFKKSGFQELTLSDATVTTSLVMKLLHQFFSCESTNHLRLCFDRVKVLSGQTPLAISTPPPPTGSRSMEITQCTLQPEIASAFPPSMSFRNLTLDTATEQGSALSVLDLFSHVHSLQVESMSLTIDTSNQNSKAIVDLLKLVDTHKWSLHFRFVISSPHCDWDLTAENIATTVDAVTDIAPTVGWLVGKGVVTLLSFAATSYFDRLPESVLEALFEEIFHGLQQSQSEVELDLRSCHLNTTALECLYHMWKTCTDVKLKKLGLSLHKSSQTTDFQQMTEKLNINIYTGCY